MSKDRIKKQINIKDVATKDYVVKNLANLSEAMILKLAEYVDSKHSLQGEKGEKGDLGNTGPQGEQGIKGEIGPQGARGEKGIAGDRGPMGPKGSQGDRGPKGEKGINGVEGPAGPRGEKGLSGKDGTMWFVESRPPKNSEGKDGDLWLDKINLALYMKQGTVWAIVGSLAARISGGGGGGGASTLAELTDTKITTPAAGNVLAYDGSDWVNTDLPDNVKDLGDLSLVKGDVLSYDGTNLKRLPVGTDDQILSADSSENEGLKWIDAAAGGVSPTPRILTSTWIDNPTSFTYGIANILDDQNVTSQQISGTEMRGGWMVLGEDTTINEISVNLASAPNGGPGDIGVGLYKQDADGNFESAAASATFLGVTTSGLKSSSITQVTLEAGWYIAMVFVSLNTSLTGTAHRSDRMPAYMVRMSPSVSTASGFRLSGSAAVNISNFTTQAATNINTVASNNIISTGYYVPLVMMRNV